MSRILLPSVVVLVVYLVVLVSLDPWDVALGTILAVGLTFGARRLLATSVLAQEPGFFRRALAFVPFAVAVAGDVVVGTWRVALVTLGIRPLVSPGVVKVPIGPRSPTAVAVAGLTLTLSPGEVLVDVDWEEGVMLIHVLDASQSEAIRDHHARFYARFQRAVFP